MAKELTLWEGSSIPPTDGYNGQIYDLNNSEFSLGNGLPYWVNTVGKVSCLPVRSSTRAYYGDGHDGIALFDNSSTPSGASGSGPYSLTRDVYYTNMTMYTNVVLNTMGWRIFVNGTLFMNTGSEIYNNGTTGGTGNTVGPAGGGQSVQASLGGSAAVNGGAGGYNTTGSNGFSASSAGYGGNGGHGGAAAYSGGNAGTSNHATYTGYPANIPDAIAGIVDIPSGTGQIIFHSYQPGGGGGGGGGAGGDNVVSGGGGGGGGGVIMIACQTLTGSGSLQCVGGHGGAGQGSFDSGGGGGGGGGTIIVVYGSKASWTGTTNVNGGSGGTGSGGASNGNGGTAGVVYMLQG